MSPVLHKEKFKHMNKFIHISSHLKKYAINFEHLPVIFQDLWPSTWLLNSKLLWSDGLIQTVKRGNHTEVPSVFYDIN